MQESTVDVMHYVTSVSTETHHMHRQLSYTAWLRKPFIHQFVLQINNLNKLKYVIFNVL